MFKRILVCLDGSSLAEQILPYATEIASHFGSRLVLLKVTLHPSAVVSPSLGYYRETPLKEIQQARDEAEAYLERIAQRLRKRGLAVDCVTLPGSPGETIVSYADKHKIGLIALGTHGHSGLGRLVFGSVADFVLKQSGLPILIRKPQQVKK